MRSTAPVVRRRRSTSIQELGARSSTSSGSSPVASSGSSSERFSSKTLRSTSWPKGHAFHGPWSAVRSSPEAAPADARTSTQDRDRASRPAAISASPTADRPLDPEALQRVTGRVLSEVSDAVTAHGGTDRIGVSRGGERRVRRPRVHEDDAMRAIRSANEIHRRLSGETRSDWYHRVGGLDVRIGISTGEVVAGGVSIPGCSRPEPRSSSPCGWRTLAEPGKTILDESTIRPVDMLVEGEWATVGAKSVFRLARLVESPPPSHGSRRRWWVASGRCGRLTDAYEQAVTTGHASFSRSSVLPGSESPGSSASASRGSTAIARGTRPLPSIRRGHHVLADPRGREGARRRRRRRARSRHRSRDRRAPPGGR